MTNKSLLRRAEESRFDILQNGTLCVENAIIISKNFAGAPTDFNPVGGKRTFTLVLTEEIGTILSENGWNVKFKEPRMEGDDPLILTEIVVNMDSKRPPRVILYSEFRGRRKSQELTSRSIANLDTCVMKNVDLVIRPYEHGRPGPHKIKGYAQEIRVMQAQDGYFDEKYADWDYDSADDVFED